jgi:C-terminal processing protease CtpA/Prc
MPRSAFYILWVLFTLQQNGQTVKPGDAFSDRQTVQKILGFEEENGGLLPTGWSGGPPGTVSADNKVVHSGQWSVRLERRADSQSSFSTLTKSLPMDFLGSQIELRGFLRPNDVSDFAGLWMREDGEGKTLAFTNMQDQKVHGTREWTEYSITLPLNRDATKLYFGVLLSGTGVAWADDLELLVDGKPIAQALEAPKKLPTIMDVDHEFDAGSRVMLSQLTPVQVENIATLGRVWGFLKYHHPQITSGQRQWDYDLFRIMPSILAARDHAGSNVVLVHWIDSLGIVANCTSCVAFDTSAIELKPDLGWIYDKAALGTPLSERLQHIYVNRTDKQQFYVSLMQNVGNPAFQHELSYTAIQFPDAGFQLLALFRFWNIMQYWAPYRTVAGENWPQVLEEFVPKIALAKDKDAFGLSMMALIARAHDTHANLWSSIKLRPPAGDCALPVNVRFLDSQAVVTGYATKNAEEASGLKAGDVVETIDGVAVTKLVETWTPLYADSNEAARLRDMGRGLTKGRCGPSAIQVRRNDQVLQLSPNRQPVAGMSSPSTHDLPGETFRLLSKDVAYLKLSSVKASDVAHDIDLAKGTKGLIVDIRNYPSEFVVFALGSLLATEDTPFATFTVADLSNPGAFHFGGTIRLRPDTPHYGGKVVILIDEVSQSQAEYTTMALRSTPNATVVGSMTAGADGNVSAIPLPGELRTMISGLGVFYPDKRPTQRVGIRPDVEARPSLVGIRAGRDEVLEVGIRQILGSSVSSTEIERLAHP